jgi:hypothetical protein
MALSRLLMGSFNHMMKVYDVIRTSEGRAYF